MNNRLDLIVEDHADEDSDLIRYLDVVTSNRWLIASIFAIVVLLGIAYAFLARPTYEADIMIQVEEDNPTSASSLLGNVSSLFDVKTEAEGELEILGYFKSGVANAAYEACGLKAEKSSLPAMRNSTVRMVLKLAYPRALRLAA